MSFLVTAAVVAVVLLLAVGRGVGREGGAPRGAWSDGLLLLACTLVLLHAGRIELVGTPLAQESLASEGDSVTLPAIGRPVSLLVGGTIAQSDSSSPKSAHYTLAVADDRHTLVRYQGTFDERWSQVGRGRHGRMASNSVVEEERIDLPVETTGRGLTLTLSMLDGELDGPVRVGLVPAPWSPIFVSLVGSLILLLGAGLEAHHTGGRLRVTCLAVLALFSLCLTHQITPGSPWVTVLGAALVSALGGIPLGFVLTALARRVLTRRPTASSATE